MKRILATTALALMMSTSAYSAAHIGVLPTYEIESTTDIEASDLIGMRVYATEQEEFAEWSMETMIDDNARTEWDDIGEVNDIILSRDGSVKSVILGIGGFLGIGERDVAVDMKALKFVSEKDEPSAFFLVVQTNKAMLEKAPAYEPRASMEDRDTNMAASDTDTTTMTNSERPMLMRPEISREGYEEVKMEQLTTEMLTGARVYGSNDEDVGEIDEILLTDEGKIDRLIIDVGGFLGIGERPVAVTLDELNIQRNNDGEMRIFIDATQEQLEAQPEYTRS